MAQYKSTIVVLTSIIFLCTSLFSTTLIINALEENDDIHFLFAELKIDQVIGDIQVHYYEHIINNVTIKNDYILRHFDVETGSLIKERYQWTDKDFCLFIPDPIEPLEITMKYHWTKPVLFMTPSDLGAFYSLSFPVSFPVFAWETRHLDGTTILYNETGSIIGQGIPAPFHGYSLSGFHDSSWPDPWINFRLNADQWFQEWCDHTISESLPTPSMISSQVSNSNNDVFYELAHGAATYFQADYYNSYYTSTMAETDMEYREPYRFAFIGSCHGMVGTGEGTFSHAFRKGLMTDTVTIGYYYMEECPGWSDALPWQDYMFYAMDNGFTIKESFDMATLNYPAIAPAVVFVGDETTTIQKEPEDDDISVIPPHVFISYPPQDAVVQGMITITGTADDIDGYVKQVYLKIGDSSWVKAEGTSTWEYEWNTELGLDGSYLITVIAIDNDNVQSSCAYRQVTVSNTPLQVQLQGPTHALVNQPVFFELEITQGTPPYVIEWDFGDGTYLFDPTATHTFSQPGLYQITVQVTDAINKTGKTTHIIEINSEDPEPLEITLIRPSNHLIINDVPTLVLTTPFIVGPFTVEAVIQDKSIIESTVLTFNGQRYLADPVNNSEPCWFINTFCFGKQLILIESNDIYGNMKTHSVQIWKFF
ncbi:MAG: PKD domain-containing protein [Bacteroidales bacterium]